MATRPTAPTTPTITAPPVPTPRAPRTPRSPRTPTTPPTQYGYVGSFVANHPYISAVATTLLTVCSYYTGKFVERNYEQRITTVVQTGDLNGDGIQPDLGIIHNGTVIPAYLGKDRSHWVTAEGIIQEYKGLDKLVNKPYSNASSRDKRENPMAHPLQIVDPTDTQNASPQPQNSGPKSFKN